MEGKITTSDGKEFVSGAAITLDGDIEAINAYINAGCPEPEVKYPNGCPILPESD